LEGVLSAIQKSAIQKCIGGGLDTQEDIDEMLKNLKKPTRRDYQV